MTSFVLDDCGINNFDQIVGMDADTVFDPWCIYYLISESRYPKCFGVCGVVWVDFKDGPWNMWRLMQNASYTISQGLPRLHQSTVTHKVSCLPGCCQILKVCEENNGDHILRTLFGYCPSPTDGMLSTFVVRTAKTGTTFAMFSLHHHMFKPDNRSNLSHGLMSRLRSRSSCRNANVGRWVRQSTISALSSPKELSGSNGYAPSQTVRRGSATSSSWVRSLDLSTLPGVYPGILLSPSWEV